MTTTRTQFGYGRHSIDEADIEAVVKVLRGDWLTTGPAVEAFELEFGRRVDAPYNVACANGTAALHLAALALGLGPGDQVIVPAITFLATANAARFVGAEVLFADVDPDNGLMLPEHVEAAIGRADRGRLKAIFPVHLNGQCGDPAGVRRLAEPLGLRVVEDACHSLGATYEDGGKKFSVGACAHADLATFSFHPVKTITTGEGGMITARDAGLDERLRRFRNHGMVRDPSRFTQADMAFEQGSANPWYYEMEEPGYNYRLCDFQSALGLSQLSKLDAMVERRAQLVARYRAALADVAPVVRPVPQTPGCHPSWHLFVTLIDFAAIGQTRAQVMRRLAKAGIGTQVHYIPVSSQPYYRNRYGEMSLPGTERYYERCLSLPLFVGMSDGDVDHIAETLRSIVERPEERAAS